MIITGGGASWALLLRKMLDGRAPPAEPEAKKSVAYKEVDIFARTKADTALSGFGDMLVVHKISSFPS